MRKGSNPPPDAASSHCTRQQGAALFEAGVERTRYRSLAGLYLRMRSGSLFSLFTINESSTNCTVTITEERILDVDEMLQL